MVNREFKKVLIVTFGALLNAAALNLFLIPADVYSAGFTGVSQLLYRIIGDYTPFHVSTGVILLLLNIPVAILGWKKVGKAFTLYSFVSVALTSLFLLFIPLKHISNDILLNAVFGAVIQAIGIGLTLKWGASTGGLDIIALVLSKSKDKPIGTYIFTLNAIIVLSAGFLFGWEKALYTLVALYVLTKVIDTVHTSHVKVTAMIVTKKAEELKEAIQSKLVRGITLIPAKGAFSSETKEVLMIVLTRYELYDLERVIKEVDPQAFTNILQTIGVYGLFRKE
ncbi:YitT family protein [Bacillus nitroreducens]